MIHWNTNKDRDQDVTTSTQRLITFKWNRRGKYMAGERLDDANVEQ